MAEDPSVASLGPEALPPPPPEEFAGLIDQPRHLHPLLRDQRTIAGIGRSWATLPAMRRKTAYHLLNNR